MYNLWYNYLFKFIIWSMKMLSNMIKLKYNHWPYFYLKNYLDFCTINQKNNAKGNRYFVYTITRRIRNAVYLPRIENLKMPKPILQTEINVPKSSRIKTPTHNNIGVLYLYTSARVSTHHKIKSQIPQICLALGLIS